MYHVTNFYSITIELTFVTLSLGHGFKTWDKDLLSPITSLDICMSGVDFTKGFRTWYKFSTEIRFMLMPIIVLFIAHEFITGKS